MRFEISIKEQKMKEDYLLLSVDILSFLESFFLIVSLLIRLTIYRINFETQWFYTLHASEHESISIIALGWWHAYTLFIE